ncbi:hypothetical protein FMM05_19580 [Flavobacterium zepuense]|uniref:Lipocalin-like domain-containing protein n=1 Tax=Flavobacterium zepuense TaxID=2593302 RepID=A0A552UUW3_9FLAO|nr:hypothetical protein [Flavobacterium zepuense]TRW21989.1 hypothetical protein FMM05_19580 [Flavobacterium zepuense]
MNTVKRNLFLILFALWAGFLTNCQNPSSQEAKSKSQEELTGAWTMVKESGGEYVLVDCGDGIETIELTADSILYKGIMEETGNKIDHLASSGDTTAIYIDSAGTSYYKFVRTDKQSGVSKWLIKEGEGPEVERFFVDKAHLATIRKSKGTASDCGTNTDDPADDSFIIGNSSLSASIEGGNCISIKDKNGNMQFERCLEEGNIVELRKVKGDFLPLTFMNGPYSMDADFILIGKNWIAKSITFYKHTPEGDLKTTKEIDVSLKDFDFGSVAEKFE